MRKGVEGEKVYFDVAVSGEDVEKVLTAVMKRFKASRDEPIKTVFLACVVAEIEILLYRDLMSEYVMNLDEVIRGLRMQSRERANYLHQKGVDELRR